MVFTFILWIKGPEPVLCQHTIDKQWNVSYCFCSLFLLQHCSYFSFVTILIVLGNLSVIVQIVCHTTPAQLGNDTHSTCFCRFWFSLGQATTLNLLIFEQKLQYNWVTKTCTIKDYKDSKVTLTDLSRKFSFGL